MRLSILFAFLAAPAWADCPDAPDHKAELSRLFEQARNAASEAEAAQFNEQMWELWTDAPDEAAQEALDRGMARRDSYDYAGALAEFERLVAYCPDYAEGYNQRAFVHFLSGRFARALEDLDRTLARDPRHVGALSGKALTLLQLDRKAEARDALDAALALNPWLGERHLAAPGGPLSAPGTDL